ncbi:TPA_asm: P [Rose alphacytorhabdovirus 1]|nr:TPA_asm: P [Rose alphacytorhabdovirus 1]
MANVDEAGENNLGLDFDGLSDPIINFALDNDGEDDSPAVEATAPAAENIPLGAKDVVQEKVMELEDDTVSALESLDEICSRMGVICTIPMKNQIKTIGKTEQIKEEHLIWYVRGLVMANQTLILPAISEAISDLRTGSRTLSNHMVKAERVNGSLLAVSKTLVKSVQEATDKVKESFETTLKHLAEEHERRIPPATTTIPDPIKVLPAKPPADTPTKSPANIPPETSKEGEKRVPAMTEASGEKILADKRKLMQMVGISAAVIKGIPNKGLSVAVPNELYAEVSSVKLTTGVKSAIHKIITKNIVQYLNDMEG